MLCASLSELHGLAAPLLPCPAMAQPLLPGLAGRQSASGDGSAGGSVVPPLQLLHTRAQTMLLQLQLALQGSHRDIATGAAAAHFVSRRARWWEGEMLSTCG